MPVLARAALRRLEPTGRMPWFAKSARSERGLCTRCLILFAFAVSRGFGVGVGGAGGEDGLAEIVSCSRWRHWQLVKERMGTPFLLEMLDRMELVNGLARLSNAIVCTIMIQEDRVDTPSKTTRSTFLNVSMF